MSDDPRVPAVTSRSQLPEADRRHFDAIAESRGGVRGPFTVLLNSPEVAGRAAHLGAYIRFESGLPGPLRELTILATAYEWDCAYEWAAHEPIARGEGVGDDAIDVAMQRGTLADLDEPDAGVVRYVRELLREHAVADETFRDTTDALGVQGVVELTATIGYYSMLACVLDAFEVQPDDQTGPF